MAACSERCGLQRTAYSLAEFDRRWLESRDELAVDVVRIGPRDARHLVVLSSGLHGVEGYFGAALQLAAIERYAGTDDGRRLPEDTALLIIHGLNPHGFLHNRRWNEDNIDLNRNFLLDDEEFDGCPELYARIGTLLNPVKKPRLPFSWQAAVAILRFGRGPLQRSIPIGQYDFPQGVFFGGKSPAATHQLLDAHLADWIDGAERVMHLDAHTGLGRWGQCTLLADVDMNVARAEALATRFGWEYLRVGHGPMQVGKTTRTGRQDVVYRSRGTLEKWCLRRFGYPRYDFVTMELGTYSMARVLAGLCDENRLHCRGGTEPERQAACRRLRELFVPANPVWRRQVIDIGLGCLEKALQ